MKSDLFFAQDPGSAPVELAGVHAASGSTRERTPDALLEGTLPRAQETYASELTNDISIDILDDMESKPDIDPNDILSFRKARGLSQQELASMLGVGVATINRWENGKAEPTGTAASVLKAVIAGSAIGGVGVGLAGLSAGAAFFGGLPGVLGGGYAVYSLLRETFGRRERLQEIREKLERSTTVLSRKRRPLPRLDEKLQALQARVAALLASPSPTDAEVEEVAARLTLFEIEVREAVGPT